MRVPSKIKLTWEGCQISVSQRKTGTKVEGQLVKTKDNINLFQFTSCYRHASLEVPSRLLPDKYTFDLE